MMHLKSTYASNYLNDDEYDENKDNKGKIRLECLRLMLDDFIISSSHELDCLEASTVTSFIFFFKSKENESSSRVAPS